MNRLFVVNKPINISSNRYLSKIKRKYRVKKAGFSGTLDPFACGCLIIAFGQYTKLFRFLKKSPKVYKATLWLGAYSPTLDIEGIKTISKVKKFSKENIKKVLKDLKGDITYLPPKYSAKKIDGQKAYTLARGGDEVKLKNITTTIYDIKLLNYSHPFLTFKISVSEGGYIRSIGEIIANKLGVDGALSYLERVCEGDFYYQNEKPLNPIDFLKIDTIEYFGNKEDILLGKKIKKELLSIKKDGEYYLVLDNFLTILSIKDDKVKYEINGVLLC